MKTIALEINDCSECPHFKLTNHYSTDGWDSMDDWFCKKENKVIKGLMESRDPTPEIPEWCPCEIKKSHLSGGFETCDLKPMEHICVNFSSHKKEVQERKPFYIEDVRYLVNQYLNDKISLSKLAEVLNEKASGKTSIEIYKLELLLEALPTADEKREAQQALKRLRHVPPYLETALNRLPIRPD